MMADLIFGTFLAVILGCVATFATVLTVYGVKYHLNEIRKLP